MRIVVVEDEAPIREGMAKLLSKINPEYELAGKAADGEAGYQLIRELNPDLVIMDIRMPKMDGIAMMKKLREENFRGPGDRADIFRGKYYVGLHAWSGAPEFTIK